MRKTNRDILTLQTDKHAKRQKGNQAINLWRNLNMDGQMDVLLKNLMSMIRGISMKKKCNNFKNNYTRCKSIY